MAGHGCLVALSESGLVSCLLCPHHRSAGCSEPGRPRPIARAYSAAQAGHSHAVGREVRRRQFRRRRESTSDIDEPHRARIGVIGVILSPKFTKWALYAPRLDEGTDFWGIGEAVGDRRLSRKATVLAARQGTRARTRPEKPRRRAQRRPRRAGLGRGWAGQRSERHPGQGGQAGRAIYVESVEVERPQAGNKMEAMEAVERVEGFFGGWSLHEAIWLGRR